MRRCPFNGCDKDIPSEMFACRPHWYSLARGDQNIIWNAYKRYTAGKIGPRELRRIQQEVLGERGKA